MHEHKTTWDRHAIMAEIRRRFGSLRELERQLRLTPGEISAALGAPYPKVEQLIAATLNEPAQKLWPDRYWPNGRRRQAITRPQRSGASQKMGAGADSEAAS